jgi:hypothetical protein
MQAYQIDSAPETEPSNPYDFTNQEVFRIPRYALPEVARAISGFARRAVRLGLEPITLEELGSEEVKIRKTQNEFSLSWDWFEIVEVVTVRITGQRPQFAGWTFVATLDGMYNDASGEYLGNLLSTVPGETCPPEYRDADARVCAHCGKRRSRKSTFVLKHEDGRVIQVGSSCIADFLGGKSAQAIAFYAQALIGSLDRARSLAGEEEERMYTGGRGERGYATLDYLTMTGAAMRTHGWVSATTARDNYSLIATRTRVDYCLSWRPTPDEPNPPFVPTAEDRARAEAALALATEHLAGLESRSDYEHNLWLVVQRGVVTGKTCGIAASIINYAEKIGQERVERAARALKPASVHQGTVGKRETWTLTVVAVREWDGMYGVTFFHRMVDAGGNVFIWKSSSDCLEVDTTYRVTGTVKEHGIYKDDQQTVLTRCKAEPVAVQ